MYYLEATHDINVIATGNEDSHNFRRTADYLVKSFQKLVTRVLLTFVESVKENCYRMVLSKLDDQPGAVLYCQLPERGEILESVTPPGLILFCNRFLDGQICFGSGKLSEQRTHDFSRFGAFWLCGASCTVEEGDRRSASIRGCIEDSIDYSRSGFGPQTQRVALRKVKEICRNLYEKLLWIWFYVTNNLHESSLSRTSYAWVSLQHIVL